MFRSIAYCLVIVTLFAWSAGQEAVREIELPGENVFPEGIAYNQGDDSLFVGSSTDGTIYRGRPDSQELSAFIEGQSEPSLEAAFGMDVDESNRLWVAGGPTETVGVFDIDSGESVQVFTAPQAETDSFFNDLVAAPDGYVYITDSFRPVLWRVQAAEGELGELESWLDLSQSPIEYDGSGVGPQATNLNGIVVTENGDYLITVDMNDGRLYRVGIESQEVSEIDLSDASLMNGDGLVIDGRTLFAVRLTENEIITIQLAEEYLSGSVEARYNHPSLQWPATAASANDRLFVVNTQFNRQQQGDPELPFTVSSIPVAQVQEGRQADAQDGDQADEQSAQGDQRASAEIQNSDGNAIGTATFMTDPSGDVSIQVELDGITSASQGEHGIHVHQVGQCEPPGFQSAGSHFNPTDQQHGLLNPEGPHAGDLPNIEIDGEGNASYETTSDLITLGSGERAILDQDGSSLMIHANPDDQTTDPGGNSGDRIACGVIAAVQGAQAAGQDQQQEDRPQEGQQQEGQQQQQQQAQPQGQQQDGGREEGEQISQPEPAISDYRPVTDERLQNPDDGDWLMWLRNYSAWSYSPLDQITTENVSNLDPVWTFSTGVSEGHEAPPIVNDGVMFVSTPENQVIALRAATGEVLWQYERELPHDLFQLHPTNRGVALYDDKVYLATLDAYLVALDATSGEVVWEQAVEDYQDAYYMTLAPLVANGNVMVGVSGGELGIRGFVQAFDAESGESVWKTYTIPAPGQPGNDTWPGDTWQHGGAPVWVTGSYDPELNLTYWGTGNAAPWTGDTRPGDNLYTNSVVALDADTGELVAHHQYRWNGSWDWDEVSTPLLIDFERNGETVPGLVHIARDGYLWWLERGQEEISFVDARPYVFQNVYESLDPETGRPEYNEERKPAIGEQADFCPSLWGGKDWPPGSYNPETGYIYIPANENHCGRMTGIQEEYVAGHTYFGSSTEFYIQEGADHIGELQAWNVNTGEEVWVHEFQGSHTWGPVMSTGGGLVFTGGTNDRYFRAFDAESGEVLWQHKTNSGISGVPISFEVDGVQYVAVQSGWGVDAARFQDSVAADEGGQWNVSVPQGGVVWVFALEDSGAVSGGGEAQRTESPEGQPQQDGAPDEPLQDGAQDQPQEEGQSQQEEQQGGQQESGAGAQDES